MPGSGVGLQELKAQKGLCKGGHRSLGGMELRPTGLRPGLTTPGHKMRPLGTKATPLDKPKGHVTGHRQDFILVAIPRKEAASLPAEVLGSGKLVTNSNWNLISLWQIELASLKGNRRTLPK